MDNMSNPQTKWLCDTENLQKGDWKSRDIEKWGIRPFNSMKLRARSQQRKNNESEV